MEKLTELEKQFREQQNKFIYYLIAVSVAAIGFSVHRTTGQPLKIIQIPLALAILCWGFSIFLGLNYLKYVISSIFSNHEYLKINLGLHPEIGDHPQKINAASSGILQALERNSKTSSSFSLWQEILFYFGIVFFLIWHVLEMYSIQTLPISV